MGSGRFKQLSAEFELLRELPPDKRAARIARLRAVDPELADELAELLAEHDAADDQMTLTVPDPKPAEVERHHIGDYKILSVLGEGGMGTVYLAQQLVPVKRRVAIKVIKLGMDTKEVIARFEAERQALALMSHPNIARVFDAGTTDDGCPFFVMEHVHGVPVNEYCDTHRLSLAERLDLFVRICLAVQHAHHKGVIHRDLKPANVLVHIQDGKPEPMIIDFGIAKATQQHLTEQTVFTAMGQIIGTPEYMSPEQADMSGLDIDTRTDVYSLGVILYELLTGELPLDACSLRSGGYQEIQRRIREEEPAKPSTRVAKTTGAGPGTGKRSAELRQIELASLVRRLRGDLDWIGMKALAKDRTHRYQTAQELADDIRRHLCDEPVLAGPPSVVYRLGKLYRRYRVQFIASALVMLCLVLGIVGTTWFAFDAQAQAEDAQNEREIADAERDKAEQARKEVTKKRDELAARDYAARLRQIDANILSGLGSTLSALQQLPGARRFAWQWLKARSEAVPMVRVSVGPPTVPNAREGIIERVDFYPSGDKVLTSTTRSFAKVVRLADKRELFQLPGRPHTAALSPDGKWIIAGYGDRPMRLMLFDAATGQATGVARAFARRVTALCVSSDSKRIAGSMPEKVIILDAETLQGEPRDIGPSTVGWVNEIEFDGKGEQLVLAGQKFGVILDGESGELRHRIPFRRSVLKDLDPVESDVRAARFSPKGDMVVLAGSGGRVAVFGTSDGQLVVDLHPHRQVYNDNHSATCLAFIADGRFVISGGLDARLRVHSMRNGAVVATVRVTDQPFSLDVSDDGSRIAIGTSEARIRQLPGELVLIETRDLLLPVALPDHEDKAEQHAGEVSSVATSEDGRFGFTIDDNSVRKWDLESCALLWTSKISDSNVAENSANDLALSPDEEEVAVVTAAGKCLILVAETGILKRSIDVDRRFFAQDLSGFDPRGVPRPRGLTRVRYTPGGELWLGVGSMDHPRSETPVALLSYDPQTGDLLQDPIEYLRASVGAIAISPDGTRMAAADFRGGVGLWDITCRPAKLLCSQSRPGTIIMALTFSEDSSKLLIPRTTGDLLLVDTHDPELFRSIPCASGLVRHLDCHPDGRTLLVTAVTGVSLWDIEQGTKLLELPFDSSGLSNAQFVLGGSSILVAGNNGYVQRWDREPR